MLNLIDDWRAYLAEKPGININKIRQPTQTDRPAGSAEILSRIEQLTDIEVKSEIKPEP